MKYCLVNGIEQTDIDIESRGLAYGDGLFTTAKINQGQIEYLSAHLDRLKLGCEKLKINPPQLNELKKQLSSIAKNYTLSVLKVMIVASSGGRGYARSLSNNHDLIIMVFDFPSHYERQVNAGIKLGLSKQNIGLNPMLAGIKHLNRLEQVLLKKELSTLDVDDLLVSNINNDVIEVTSANIFFFMQGELTTPDLSQSGVDGIMRQTILKYFPNTIIKAISIGEVNQADAMFVCNCVMGIIPIANYNGRKLSIELPLSLRQDFINKASTQE